MLKTIDVKRWAQQKTYPIYLGAILCCTAIVFMLFVHLTVKDPKFVWTVVGIEMLLYMLLNAFSCLLVPDLWTYIKRTMGVYLLNLAMLGLVLYMLLGPNFMDFSGNFAAFGALIFCFFASLILISFIRGVADFFKNE